MIQTRMSTVNKVAGQMKGGGTTGDVKGDVTSVNKTVIRGTFNLKDLSTVVYLIKSLCPESGHLGQFRDWDRIYSGPGNNGGENRGNQRTTIRLRTHIPLSSGKDGRKDWRCHTLMYLGAPDRRVVGPCEKRPVTTVRISQEADGLLATMGCRLGYEYVRKGVRYRTRNGVLIEVFVVERLRQAGDPSACDPISTDGQYVVVEMGNETGITDELHGLMGMLGPYVVVGGGGGGVMAGGRR